MSDSAFGLWLKQRRRTLDLTQEDLGERVGYTAATIRKIEAGERRPSRDVAERLAAALELAPGEQARFVQMARAAIGREQPSTAARPDPADAAPCAQPITTRSAVVARDALPVPPTALVGRAAELAEVGQLLSDSASRLISLIGLGGAGKTRLAIAAAGQYAGLFADGAAFVPLAGIASAEQLAPAVADALGYSLYGTDEPRAQLLRYLRDKQLLLILDNLEHLLGGASTDAGPIIELLSAILQHAPAVKLLVTSRERLQLHDEWVVEIQGLPVPGGATAGAFAGSAAVALFLQQARKAQTDFVLSDADRPAVARICQLLEGMPLGIELAAAWARVLSCAEIAREIERSLDFLAASARDMPPRHRSLRAVFDHSWALLSDTERQVLRRLSVCRGGFTRAAAEAVCAELSVEHGAGRSVSRQPTTHNFQSPGGRPILTSLASLMDKSLLQRGSGGRYDMHGLVRQYARDQLKADRAEYIATHDRHCGYYAAWLQARDSLLRSADQGVAVMEICAEIDNLRLAGEWAITNDRLTDLRLSIRTLSWFYELRGWLREGAAVFEQLVTALSPRPQSSIPEQASRAAENSAAERAQGREAERTITLAQVLAQQGWFCFRQGQRGRASELLRRSLELLQGYDAPQARADTLAFLGYLCYTTGEYADARRFLQAGLAISRAIGDRWTAVFCQSDLGELAYLMGEYQQARELCREALAAWRTIGDLRGRVCILSSYGAVAAALGEYAEARALLQEALDISAVQHDRWGLAMSFYQLGGVAYTQGDHAESAYLFRESVSLFRETGDHWYVSRALNALGYASYALAAYTKARRYFHEALKISLASQAPLAILEALAGLASIRANQGGTEAALAALAYIQDHPASSAQLGDRAQRLSAEAAAVLTPSQAEAARRRGRAMTLEAAVEVVRELPENDLKLVAIEYSQACLM